MDVYESILTPIAILKEISVKCGSPVYFDVDFIYYEIFLRVLILSFCQIPLPLSGQPFANRRKLWKLSEWNDRGSGRLVIRLFLQSVNTNIEICTLLLPAIINLLCRH